tara:strand:- start:2348 stop:2689 length:342 start_codon:yes stop_codon:yes gene_type:complete
MIGHPLGIQYEIPLLTEPLNQMDKGDLTGIRFSRKHGFAEKSPTERNTVEPTLQPIGIPTFNRMSETFLVKLDIALDNCFIYPCLFSLPTCFNHLPECRVPSDLKGLFPEHSL